MDLPPTSRLSFFDLGGNSIDGPIEWVSALIEVGDAIDHWKGMRLTRQDNEDFPLSLRLLGGRIRVIANWPNSGPGHYRLNLFSGDTKIEELTITIQPKKISADAYTRLLEDLETRLPAAIAVGLQHNAAFAGLKFLPPGESTLAMELVRLRRAIKGYTGRIGLAQVLNDLTYVPHKVLSTTTLWMPRERARRPHPSMLVQAISRPHNIDESGLPLRILDTRVEHSVDVYENRLVKVYSHQVALRLQRLIHVLGSKQNSSLLMEAQALRGLLDSARRRAMFLHEVTLPAYLPTKITMVLFNRPLYRAALEGYLEFNRSPSVYFGEPALEAPLENLPFLYQIWGTLEVLMILLEVTGNLGYQVKHQRLTRKSADSIFIQLLPDGDPLVILEHPVNQTMVKFISERTYGRQHVRGSQKPLHSISFEQRPDIAVEIQTPDGPARIYLFDPKYKLEGGQAGMDDGNGLPKKEDIDKMHAYRDAIRDEAQRRVVQSAAILYPGSSQRYADGIEALQAYPGLELALEERLRDIFTAALQV